MRYWHHHARLRHNRSISFCSLPPLIWYMPRTCWFNNFKMIGFAMKYNFKERTCNGIQFVEIVYATDVWKMTRGILTSCAGMTSQNCNISSVSKYIQVKQNRRNDVINLLLVNNFCPMISYRREFKRRVTNHCIRFGHSLRSAISCQRDVFNLAVAF